MDAGVPLKAPVAGISCGLITKPDSDEFMTMVDIQGLEDFFGDMDFKVGGTKNGITAIQVDIKVDGLTPAIIAEAFEKRSAAFFTKGLAFNKFTGSCGKSGSNDANAEYEARVRNIFDSHEVAFQTAELGKVDVGGGGTIAYIAALYGMEVIDSGVAVLSLSLIHI